MCDAGIPFSLNSQLTRHTIRGDFHFGGNLNSSLCQTKSVKFLYIVKTCRRTTVHVDAGVCKLTMLLPVFCFKTG